MSTQLWQVLIIILGSVTSGCGISFPSPTGPSITSHFGYSQVEQNIFNSITHFTSILGPLIAHWLLTRKGRRTTLSIISCSNFACWLILPITSLFHRYSAIFHRALIGLTHGAYFVIIPLYIMEITPSDHRVSYGLLHHFGVSFGSFITNLIGSIISWRLLPILLSFIPLS
jgi:MFS family permease